MNFPQDLTEPYEVVELRFNDQRHLIIYEKPSQKVFPAITSIGTPKPLAGHSLHQVPLRESFTRAGMMQNACYDHASGRAHVAFDW